MQNRRTFFTLIEVIISLAILTMGLMAALNMASTSTNRSLKAHKIWKRQHMLAQAAEYYLLLGPTAELPESVFPYEGYSVNCEVVDPEGVPDEALEDVGSWRLVCLNMQLMDGKGDVVETLKIDKIMHRDDL